ncbi:MAG: AAA family ATPase [Crocinitomicaceae bacterium]|tara:strand:+ start:2663 stop:4069 length:1407 start_codon:yes stop_codon:yes gene_type:complete
MKQNKILENVISLSEIDLSQDQITALNLFENFLEKDPSDGLSIFILSGYAGTGKSTLTSLLNKSLKGFKINTRLAAPTGRAAKVLSVYAGQKAQTVHKEIYFGGSALEKQVKLKAVKNKHRNTIFFIDEASMIPSGVHGDNDILHDLISYVKEGYKCKLVFIGDAGQLPPVGQDSSPALDVDFLESTFANLTVFAAQLKQIFRTRESSSIISNATYIRNKVVFEPPFIIDLDTNTQSLKGYEVHERIEESIHSKGNDNVVVLTLSNKQANRWNNGIRKSIHFREEILESNESLMVIRNNYFWISATSALGFLANGENIRIEKLIKEETLYGFDFAKVLISFPNYPDEDYKEVLVMKDTLLIDGATLSRDKMKELFFEIEKDYWHISSKSKRYQEILMNPYFNALHVKYANALTVHKSQGGQWSDVFIDGSYIPEQMKDSSYLRWLYTAATRAKENLYLVNFPEEFFLR